MYLLVLSTDGSMAVVATTAAENKGSKIHKLLHCVVLLKEACGGLREEGEGGEDSVLVIMAQQTYWL